MKVLDLIPLAAGDHLVYPEEFHDLDSESPALAVFTDFRRHAPQVLEQHFSAVEAERLMRKAHVRLMLVLNQSGECVGTISAADLDEQSITRQLGAGQLREELQVGDLMRARSEILALEFEQLRRARVRDLIDTLQAHGQQHCLVLDTGQRHIRGMISSSDIARRLHVPIEIGHRNGFTEIFEAMRL